MPALQSPSPSHTHTHTDIMLYNVHYNSSIQLQLKVSNKCLFSDRCVKRNSKIQSKVFTEDHLLIFFFFFCEWISPRTHWETPSSSDPHGFHLSYSAFSDTTPSKCTSGSWKWRQTLLILPSSVHSQALWMDPRSHAQILIFSIINGLYSIYLISNRVQELILLD